MGRLPLIQTFTRKRRTPADLSDSEKWRFQDLNFSVGKFLGQLPRVLSVKTIRDLLWNVFAVFGWYKNHEAAINCVVWFFCLQVFFTWIPSPFALSHLGGAGCCSSRMAQKVATGVGGKVLYWLGGGFKSKGITLLETNISSQNTSEDNFPFPKLGYVSSLAYTKSIVHLTTDMVIWRYENLSTAIASSNFQFARICFVSSGALS